ncbi:hypothetical protein IWQ60_002963 [Tieghemiomyces parasiticus]|uniref:Beta-catenin-like protein 1 N-terminal domain-containing protein n=1 Tax=Tieghemiomyces parasiticus TaxID=78921 RepID=A0A9W8AB49_9FUNG|nr:hypothetical protein IWQ60_002963 [Tieghemiomyces parasiticus]
MDYRTTIQTDTAATLKRGSSDDTDLEQHLAQRARTAPSDGGPVSDGAWEGADDDDEDEGRFFGDGMTEEQREIVAYVEGLGAPTEGSHLATADARRLFHKLQKAVVRNRELRAKYPDTPARFMESEVELDAALHQLLDVSQAPNLFPDLVELGLVPVLLDLLTHENSDVAAVVIQLLNEWTDEETVENAAGEEAIQSTELDSDTVDALIARERQISHLLRGVQRFVDAVIAAQGLPLVVQNLDRLSDANPDDQPAIFQTLGFAENLVNLDARYAEAVVSQTDLLSRILTLIRQPAFTANGQYASELLVILLQTSVANRVRLGALGGIDQLLRALATYRRRDPASDDELEFMENLFDALCLSLREPELQYQFLKSEGVELMVLMLKERRVSRSRALKVLNYATCTSHTVSQMVVEAIVEHAGLAPLMRILMKQGLAKFKRAYKHVSETEEEEHTVSLLAALLRHTDPVSPARWRIINKFLESNYERVDRLVELHQGYSERLLSVDQEIAQERKVRDPQRMDIRRVGPGGIPLSHSAILPTCHLPAVGHRQW